MSKSCITDGRIAPGNKKSGLNTRFAIKTLDGIKKNCNEIEGIIRSQTEGTSAFDLVKIEKSLETIVNIKHRMKDE